MAHYRGNTSALTAWGLGILAVLIVGFVLLSIMVNRRQTEEARIEVSPLEETPLSPLPPAPSAGQLEVRESPVTIEIPKPVYKDVPVEMPREALTEPAADSAGTAEERPTR